MVAVRFRGTRLAAVLLVFFNMAYFDGFRTPAVFGHVHVNIFVDVHIHDLVDEYVAMVAVSAPVNEAAVRIAAGWITPLVDVDALVYRGQYLDGNSAFDYDWL